MSIRKGGASGWNRDEEMGVYGVIGWLAIIVFSVFGITRCNQPPARQLMPTPTASPVQAAPTPTTGLILNLDQGSGVERAEPVPTSPARECLIKGNISINSGEKIYHVPGQKYYEQTRISTQYGEQWFCSEEEAEAAGWRKAYE